MVFTPGVKTLLYRAFSLAWRQDAMLVLLITEEFELMTPTWLPRSLVLVSRVPQDLSENALYTKPSLFRHWYTYFPTNQNLINEITF